MTRTTAGRRQLARPFGTCLTGAGAAAIAVVTASPWSTTKINISMGVWFKSLNYKTNRQLLITNGNGAIAGYGLYISGNATTDGSVFLLNHQVAWVDLGFKVTDNEWHHIMLTIDGSNNAVVYLDGVSRYTGTPTLGTPSGLSGFFNDSAAIYRGKIDDGRFYSRQLTAAEVTNLFYGTEPSPAPANWYDFDEGSGTTALDKGSSPKNATAGGNTFPNYSMDVFTLARTVAGARTLA